jgi:hypothetical protein
MSKHKHTRNVDNIYVIERNMCVCTVLIITGIIIANISFYLLRFDNNTNNVSNTTNTPSNTNTYENIVSV